MKRLLLLACAACLSLTARASTILPDACGKDEVKFDVKTEKNQPAPSSPADGKAQIVFVETLETPGHRGGSITTRFGVDGSWAGAVKGESYFVYTVAPGEHHLCANWQSHFGKLERNIGMATFTAEAGKTYYYEFKITAVGGGEKQPATVSSALNSLTEDAGRYRVKASPLATSTSK